MNFFNRNRNAVTQLFIILSLVVCVTFALLFPNQALILMGIVIGGLLVPTVIFLTVIQPVYSIFKTEKKYKKSHTD